LRRDSIGGEPRQHILKLMQQLRSALREQGVDRPR